MLRQFLKKLVLPRQVAGIEIRPKEQGVFYCDYVVAETKSGQLAIKEQSENAIPLQGVLEKLPKHLPVCIVLGGKGAMAKKSQSTVDDTGHLINELFPNIQTSEFAFQYIQLAESTAVAVARNETIAFLVAEFEKAGHFVLSFDLAFGSSQPAISVVKAAGQILETNDWVLTLGDNGITDFRPTHNTLPVEFQFGGQALHSRLFLAFTACFNAFLDIGSELQNAPTLRSSRKNHQYQQITRLFGSAFLGILLLALLANTMIYFSLEENLQRQSIALASQGNNAALLDSLQKANKTQQLFLEKNSLQDYSITGWYADQLGASLVSGIQLSSVDIFPHKKTTSRTAQENGSVEFERNLILITGTSVQSYRLNEWIKKLKSLPWVSEVKVMPYSENQAGNGSFELQVRIK